MKLIWNGHSCFTLDTAQGCVVLDPYRDGSVPGLSPLHLTADLVLCSHEHRDHGAREAVELTGRPVSLQVEELHTSTTRRAAPCAAPIPSILLPLMGCGSPTWETWAAR